MGFLTRLFPARHAKPLVVDDPLREAAKILARDCCGVRVGGSTAVHPEQVSRIAREWLELTEPETMPNA